MRESVYVRVLCENERERQYVEGKKVVHVREREQIRDRETYVRACYVFGVPKWSGPKIGSKKPITGHVHSRV